jgi:acyl carrier protein
MYADEVEIRSFIIETFLFGQDGSGLSSEDSFLEKGIIDSTGVLELVTYLEKKFEIKIADEELSPNNLDTLNSIVQFVNRKLQEKG